MNSRERVLAACERRRPDRPPIDLTCTPEAFARLQTYLGVATDNAVLDRLDVDMRRIGVPFIGPAERSAVPLGSEGTDFWGCRIRKVETEFNTYYEWAGHPLADCKTVVDVEAYDWPSLDWWDYAAMPRLIEEQNAADRRAIMFMAGGAFETPWYLRGLEQFLIDLRQQPEIAEAISRRVEEYYRLRALRVLDAARGQIDIVGSGGDIGTQRGMMLNPVLWRRHIKPYTGRLIGTFKALGFKTFYHSCGSIVPVIPDLIEVGLDLLDPIQPQAAGMNPEALFEAFGDRLSFHGGIDEQELLPHGTPEQVYRETTRIIDVLGRNGGYVVAAAHNVQGDTPPENVEAMCQAARDYRWY
jgi:uroporphyrinogen decarboxylase